jgi:hypothetical protein
VKVVEMTVNPNLATLMRVIEDQQHKMSEGEYLEAMNALGALHRAAISVSSLVHIQPENQQWWRNWRNINLEDSPISRRFRY